MSITERLRKFDHLQQTTRFKIIASAAIVLASATLLLVMWLTSVAAGGDASGSGIVVQDEFGNIMTRAQINSDPELAAEYKRVLESDEYKELLAAKEKNEASMSEDERLGTAVLNAIQKRAQSSGSKYLAVLVAMVLALAVTWLGLLLLYAVIGTIAGVVIWRLYAMDSTRGLAVVLAGSTLLAVSFTALMAFARMSLSSVNGSVTAIARTLLAEAVRMKVSLVLIVLLILGLALIPGMLSKDELLRYRVQNFLQYSTTGSFWVLGFLTILLAAGSVAFEQRDKVIWQTMTKPVSAWRYVFGKWLGVCMLNIVLLGVCGIAIYLFTGYLSHQTARGEITPGVGKPGTPVTNDRFLLETQVLTARTSVTPDVPLTTDHPDFKQAVGEEMQRMLDFGGYEDTPEWRATVEHDYYRELLLQSRTIEPGGQRRYVFSNLGALGKSSKTFSIKYRVDAGANRPDAMYKLTFVLNRHDPIPIDATLATTLTLDRLSPRVIDENGQLELIVLNGDIRRGVPAQQQTINLPPGTLEITYSAGTFEMNYFRVLVVLWAKLAFMAIIAIASATFLSFPVAALMSFGMFFLTEGSGYIATSVEFYLSGPDKGFARVVQIAVTPIAQVVRFTFGSYGKLTPLGDFVQGLLVPWSAVAMSVFLLGIWSVVLYFAGVLIFRKRELAIYSGK